MYISIKENINKMYQTAQPWIRTTVLISPEFYNLCKQHHIKFSEAIRMGISICLAERGVLEYDNKLNLHRKMNIFREQAEKALQELEELKSKHVELIK